MDQFEHVSGNESSAKWRWTDTLPAYDGVSVQPPTSSRFQIPGGVRLHAALSLDYVRPDLGLVRWAVQDEEGNARCAGPCGLGFPDAFPTTETWQVNVWLTAWPENPVPFTVNLTLLVIDPQIPKPVAFGPHGVLDLPPGHESRFVIHPTGLLTGEPTIGATRDGTLFTVSDWPNQPQDVSKEEWQRFFFLRSDDSGRTWQSHSVPGSEALDLDPWLWVDTDTDRIFRLALKVACSQMARSDDQGGSWQVSTAGCMHPGHHYQKLTTGPPPPGVATQGYPNIIYYAASVLSDYLTGGLVVGDTGGVIVSTSRDGGDTWNIGALAHPARRACSGFGGPIVVAPDGTAYSPAQYCDGVRIAISKDGGTTWTLDAMLDDVGHMKGFLGPSMAVDTEGRAYVVYPAADAKAVLRWRDPATGTWSAPITVSPPNVKATTYTLVDSPGPGQVAIAFLGTESDPATWAAIDPLNAPATASWHLHVVMSENTFTAAPVFVAHHVTDPDDPVQRGCIDMTGSQTPTCRNISDFTDMTLVDGRPIVVFQDGCLRCADAATSTSEAFTVALIAEG